MSEEKNLKIKEISKATRERRSQNGLSCYLHKGSRE